MMYLKSILFFTFIFVGYGSLVAQDYITKKTAKGAAKKAFDRGMEYNIKGDNLRAIHEFEKALKAAPDFIDAHLQWAAMKYDLNLHAEAEAGFEKVLDIDPSYNTKVFYTAGIAESHQEKFAEAATHFQQYLDSGPKNKILLSKTKRHLANCIFKTEIGNKRVPFEPQSIGDNINTTADEYLPSLTADGVTLVYTRKSGHQEDFYISRKTQKGWRQGRAMEDINTNLSEGAQSISADGKFLVFTACNRSDGKGSCDLYFSEVKKGKWTKPANIGAPINTTSWESQPSISADGKTLYFSWASNFNSQNRDIRVSHRLANGRWSAPKGLGEDINTPYSEQSPFIHSDGQTLYFMSNGHPGFGSHDLFYSRKQDNGNWSIPINMGFPINTAAAEGAMIISLDGKTAYFSTDRANPSADGISPFDKPESKGNSDIYTFALYEAARPLPLTYVQARVYDAETKKPLEANVEFVELQGAKTQASSITDRDGEFLVCLPLGNNYALNVSKENYLFHSENFTLIDRESNKPYVLEIALQKIPESLASTDSKPAPVVSAKPIVLKNVFFDTGSANLRSESYIELNRLKELLEKNARMQIQINGHTDDIGTEVSNMALSTSRAKAVYQYLINGGINASRLRFKGFGESKAIDTNETSGGRQRNRRTEFLITGV